MRGLEPGELLGGKYRLIRHLGQGGMGSVWHAQHLTLNAPVALKFIGSDKLDGEALQRFLGEARIAAALRSPHVVQILDYGVVDGAPHIAMELLVGESLAERLAREGRLDLEQTARMVQHVVRAIGRAHDAGVVHRDLKPENVFIVENDDDELIKVLDFGIAKGNAALFGDSAAVATRSGALMGTPHYMSPEQVEGSKSVDHRTDIWSLGVLVYRCLLGQLPFAGDNVGRLVLSICSRPLPVPSAVGEVPLGFDAWFACACAREPSERFAAARQAAHEFLALLEDASAVRGPASLTPRAEPVALDAAPNETSPERLGTTAGHATHVDVPALAEPVRRSKRHVAVAAALVLLVALTTLVLRSQTNSLARTSVVTPRSNPDTAAAGAAAALPVAEASAAREPPSPPALASRENERSPPRPSPAEATRTEPSEVRGATPPRSSTPTPKRDSARRAEPSSVPARSKPPALERVPAIPPPDINLGI